MQLAKKEILSDQKNVDVRQNMPGATILTSDGLYRERETTLEVS